MGSALSCAAGYTGIDAPVNVCLADQDSLGCGRAEVLYQGSWGTVVTLGATKILELFAGNLDPGTSRSLRDVVHATGKGLGIFGRTT